MRSHCLKSTTYLGIGVKKVIQRSLRDVEIIKKVKGQERERVVKEGGKIKKMVGDRMRVTVIGLYV